MTETGKKIKRKRIEITHHKSPIDCQMSSPKPASSYVLLDWCWSSASVTMHGKREDYIYTIHVLLFLSKKKNKKKERIDWFLEVKMAMYKRRGTRDSVNEDDLEASSMMFCRICLECGTERSMNLLTQTCL